MKYLIKIEDVTNEQIKGLHTMVERNPTEMLLLIEPVITLEDNTSNFEVDEFLANHKIAHTVEV